MKYFRHRKYTVDCFTTHDLMVPPNVSTVHYHDELTGVDIEDSEEILLFQHPECEVTEAAFEEVEVELKKCRQYHDINEIVKKLIADQYSIADEIAMIKLPEDHPERATYEKHVLACREIGKQMKIARGLKLLESE